MLRASILTLGAFVLALTGCPSSPSSPDASDATMDVAADVPVEAAVMDVLMVSYGRCGMRTYTCLCGCGDAGDCQQGCFTANTMCVSCLRNAIMMCCPTEWSAFTDCITAAITPDDSGMAQCAAADNACILAACPMQVNALDACQGSTACAGPTRTCLGTYPQTCGM